MVREAYQILDLSGTYTRGSGDSDKFSAEVPGAYKKATTTKLLVVGGTLTIVGGGVNTIKPQTVVAGGGAAGADATFSVKVGSMTINFTIDDEDTVYYVVA